MMSLAEMRLARRRRPPRVFVTDLGDGKIGDKLLLQDLIPPWDTVFS